MENSLPNMQVKIADYLIGFIRKNHLQTNDRLPSQTELSRYFGVNRNVVRAAVSHLRSQGHIYTRQGKGAFVAARSKPVTLNHVIDKSFSELLLENHENYTNHLVKWARTKAGASECAHMKLPRGTEVYRLQTLRSMGKLRFALCLSSIPAELIPGVEHYLEDFSSIDDVLINHYNITHPVCDFVTISCRNPTAEESSVLQMPEDVPILQLVSTFSTPKNGIVEYFLVRARGDQFRFNMRFDEFVPTFFQTGRGIP